VERPPPSERVASTWSDNDRESVCNNIEVDVKREHRRVCEDASGRRSLDTRMSLVQGPHSRLPLMVTIDVDGRRRQGVGLHT